VNLPEPVTFPDVEAVLVGHLADALDVPVSTMIPNPRPSRFVRLLRTGGPATSVVIDQAQITVEAWGDSPVDAALLAAEARAALNAMTGRVPGVQRVAELAGPANLPDEHSSQARYSWSLIVNVRGHAN
jgi:hypothetical protein